MEAETAVAQVEEELTPRQRVERLERILENAPPAQCYPVQHHFAPGVYVRTLIVPAGVIATGAVHKTEHLTIIAGHCMLTTDDGAREFIGYETILSKPGTKRAIYAIETTVVTTIHATDETDPERLCELLTETTADKLLGGENNLQALTHRRTTEYLQ